ncbi:galactosyltransferase-related protein [Mucilaginibacter sp. RCC_168]|uniref:galactosyltransferase-related protein n=1 Tax=Mucilaginibacter sp. RCC_168 TaxID=3239221 RepID=UPI003523DB47
MKNPAFTVIIPWYNRPEILKTLQANKSIFKKYGAEVIISNVGGDPGMIKHLCDDNIRIVQILYKKFNKCLALNIGALSSSSETLFFLDADMILTEDFIEEALAHVDNNNIVIIDEVLESSYDKQKLYDNSQLDEVMVYLDIKAKNGRTARIRMERQPVNYYSKIGNGIIFLKKKDFLSVNGMNSNFIGWGFEDNDLLIRLQLQLDVGVKIMGSMTHLTHDDSLRDTQGKTIEEHEKINSMVALQFYIKGIYEGTFNEDIALNNVEIVPWP